MCGICAATGHDAERLVDVMNKAQEHRGPDDVGVYFDEGAQLAIGARRLSIIDVEGGHQPLCDESGLVWAVQNGEIYNHAAVRTQLLRSGHRFRSRTDTEVVVHAYEEYGQSFVHALEGMFAIVIWDARSRTLTAARDRFGEKPLFYTERGGNLFISSELTALVTAGVAGGDIDADAVDDLFVFGYVRNPRSILRGVFQLPPAHLLTWTEQDRRVELRRYWQLPLMPVAHADSPHPDEVAAEADRLLRASVRSRMVADVPLGILLSGGVDSTLLAAYGAAESMRPIKTFTVDFDVGSVGESGPARRVAEAIGADHHEVLLAAHDVASRVPSVLASLDQPIADQALVATHAVCEVARKEVTVAVGGEGADELFGGYPRYRWMVRAERLQATSPRGALRGTTAMLNALPMSTAARRLTRLTAPTTTSERNLAWVTSGRHRERSVLYGPMLAAIGGDPVHDGLARSAIGERELELAAKLIRLDQRTWLPDDVLAKADRASMLVSLELRTPYLHRELAELAAMLPAAVHVGRRGKSVLRQLLQGALPAVPSRSKQAFQVPASEWLRGPLLATVHNQLRSGEVFNEGWFNRAAVAGLVGEHLSGRRDHSATLWPVLTFGLWLNRFRGSGHAG
jgi:asparagine synthase (glutamine-hydrolysing)